MGHKAIDEVQTLILDKEDEETEGGMWDFLNIHNICDEGKKRLLITGDSITGGINGVIRDIINPSWVVDSYTTSLPIHDRDFLSNLEMALTIAGKPYDVIHFNNGGHGHESAQTYERCYREVIATIKRLQPGAKIVLATCIASYIPEADGSFARKNMGWHQYTDKRDEVCRRLADEYGLSLNDLASYSPNIKDDHRPDGVHYKEEGNKKLAFQVIKFAR